MPKFSIVVPTYNHGHLISRCLKSLQNQTYGDWEAIVVNNYSEDNTVDVVKSFGDSRIRLVNFRNKGVIAASRNKGIKHCLGSWICFLDSDDWWFPQKLERISQYLETSDLIFHDLDYYENPDSPNGRKLRGRILRTPVFEDLMLLGNCISNSSVAVRRVILEKVGGLDEQKRLVAVEDFDLWLRISEQTDKFYYIPESLGAYWVGGGNISTVSSRQILRERVVLAKHWGKLNSDKKRQVMLRLFYIQGTIYKKIGKLEKAKKLFKISLTSNLRSVKLRSFINLIR